jgi:ankyrin repeat protein
MCLSIASGANNDGEVARLFLQSSDLIKDYIKKMASINTRHEPCKMTILDHAVVNGNYEIAEFLLQRGADPNSRWASRDTSLHAAAEAGDVAMIRLLLLFGADPDAKNNVSSSGSNICRRSACQSNSQ